MAGEGRSLSLLEALKQSNTSDKKDPNEENGTDANDLEAGEKSGDFAGRKASGSIRKTSIVNHEIAVGTADEVARAKEIQQSLGVLRVLRRGEEWLDAKLGIELQGIDRVPEEAKRPPSTLNIFLLWWSLNVHVGVVPLGVLGPEFGLSFGQTVGAAIAGNLLGSICTAFDGTLGPKVCKAQESRAIKAKKTDILQHEPGLSSISLFGPPRRNKTDNYVVARTTTNSRIEVLVWLLVCQPYFHGLLPLTQIGAQSYARSSTFS